MQLEQKMYQPIQMQRTMSKRQRVYTIADLESLSASALYSDGKNFVKKDGTIETVLPKFIGNDSVKVYINPLTGKIDAGYQKSGESHKDYSSSGRMTNLNKGSRS